MDAVDFIVTRDRMCKSFNNRCRGCEIANRMDGNESCNDYIKRCPAEAVAIVEKWSKEHPRKTRRSEFLKLFPTAKVDIDNIPVICPKDVCVRFRCCVNPDERACGQCRDCRKKYWLEEVEEDDQSND